MNGENRILVETEALIAEAGVVKESVSTIQSKFEDVADIINAVNFYWEGDGAETHKNMYLQKTEKVEEVCRRFREHVRDLYEIAGIYEEAESNAAEEAEALPSDVIV